jgi:hypothetical protein
MLSGILAIATTASLTVLKTVATKKLFEAIIRKLVVALLKFIVSSTENKVDDIAVAPIIKELER